MTMLVSQRILANKCANVLRSNFNQNAKMNQKSQTFRTSCFQQLQQQQNSIAISSANRIFFRNHVDDDDLSNFGFLKKKTQNNILSNSINGIEMQSEKSTISSISPCLCFKELSSYKIGIERKDFFRDRYFDSFLKTNMNMQNLTKLTNTTQQPLSLHSIRNFGIQIADATQFKVFIVDQSGSLKQVTMTEKELITKKRHDLHLHLRDLRRLYIDGVLQDASTILVAESCFILRMEHIKALVEPHQVIIFDSKNPAVQRFAKKLASGLEIGMSNSHLFFEHLILEATLSEIIGSFEHQLQLLSPVIERILDNIADDATTESLTVLIPVRNSLAKFEMRVRDVMTSIESILANDRYLNDMYLTFNSTSSLKREGDDHLELEVLLEFFVKRCQEVRAKILLLEKHIEMIKSLKDIAFSGARNSLLRLNVQVTIVSVAIMVGSMIGTFFGMNLDSGLAMYKESFWIASGATVFLTTAAYIYYRRVFNRVWDTGKLSPAAKGGRFSFWENINTADYVNSHLKMDRDQLKDVLGSITGRDVPQSDVEKIFRRYDFNADNFLNTSELKVALSEYGRKIERKPRKQGFSNAPDIFH